MVDRELLLRKAAALEQYLTELEEFRNLQPETYRGDWKTQRIVERSLHLAIEVCLDLADHLIADRRLRVPATQAETFEILRDAKLLDSLLATSLIQMAKFRNILVHDYARIDPDQILRILREHLQDLEAFRLAVVASV